MNQTINRFKKEKLITNKNAGGLNTSDPRTQRFYITPKIHKPGNPGRAVISLVNCYTINISKNIDYHLKPVLNQIPCYVRNANDFINKMDDIGNISPNSFSVTMDVKPVYTNALNSEGISAVKHAYVNY